jgi:homoserine kinase type II
MATFTPLPEEEARALLEAYDLGELRRVVPIPEGSVNSNFRLETEKAGERSAWFLRLFEEQGAEGAEYDAALLSHLAREGVPTPCPVVRADGGSVSFVFGDKPATLFPFVPGASTCQRAVDRARAHAVGRALAQVHVAGASFPMRRQGRFRLEDLHARMPRIAAAEDPAIAAMAKVLPDELARWCDARTDVPEGVIHGDLFRDNVLFRAESGEGHDEVAALLDFESASDGRLVYDLAVTILAWSQRDAFDPQTAAAILDGYGSIRPLEEIERRALRGELAIAALRFTTTRITDYALRSGIGARVIKDWRRFWERYRAVQEIEPFW